MSDRKQRTLVIEQARTLRQPFRVRVAQTGAVFDPPAAGYNAAILQVRDRHEGDILLSLDTDSGIVLGKYDDGTGKEWSGYLYADADTTDVEPWGEAVWDLVMIHDGGDRDTVARGPAVLIPAVSEVVP